MSELNFFDLFLKASVVVQIVISILILFSIISWAIIIQRSKILSKALKQYTKSKEKNLNKLIYYARQLNVEEEIRKYLEVML